MALTCSRWSGRPTVAWLREQPSLSPRVDHLVGVIARPSRIERALTSRRNAALGEHADRRLGRTTLRRGGVCLAKGRLPVRLQAGDECFARRYVTQALAIRIESDSDRFATEPI
jgi:hypothetical protein